jgi:hypothetical protein
MQYLLAAELAHTNVLPRLRQACNQAWLDFAAQHLHPYRKPVLD